MRWRRSSGTRGKSWGRTNREGGWAAPSTQAGVPSGRRRSPCAPACANGAPSACGGRAGAIFRRTDAGRAERMILPPRSARRPRAGARRARAPPPGGSGGRLVPSHPGRAEREHGDSDRRARPGAVPAASDETSPRPRGRRAGWSRSRCGERRTIEAFEHERLLGTKVSVKFLYA